jgi:CRISPR-associated protein Cas2
MVRFMRLLVFFDLPVKSKNERKIYTQFRKSLIADGFFMVQYSVYCRICNGYDSVVAHEKIVEKVIPAKGSVRTLAVTEKQYEGMKILVGRKRPNDKKFIEGQISFF